MISCDLCTALVPYIVILYTYCTHAIYICSCSQPTIITNTSDGTRKQGGSVRRNDDDVEKLNKRKQRTTNHRVPLSSFVCCLCLYFLLSFCLSYQSLRQVIVSKLCEIISTTITRLEQLKLPYTPYTYTLYPASKYIRCCPRNNLISTSEPRTA